jgi:hypothetical protein
MAPEDLAAAGSGARGADARMADWADAGRPLADPDPLGSDTHDYDMHGFGDGWCHDIVLEAIGCGEPDHACPGCTGCTDGGG